MSAESLEVLFERFRERGDPAALAEVFDRTAPELLRVAHHLAGGLGEAEDLVQETFVVAIERARRFDAARGLLPWLLGILAKRALKARGRRGAHPPQPGRWPEREVADPAEELERAELRRALEAGIAALEPPYREVLAKHLLDGRRAVEIARELGRAPGTVRMQLMRGLEQLRRALPAGLAAGAGLATGTRGLAGVRADVVARAARVGAAPAGTLTGTMATIGGALVSTKVVVGIVGAAGALTLAWLARGPGGSVPVEPDLGGVVTSRIDAHRSEPAALGRGETAAPRARDEERTALAAASADEIARNWKVVGEVRGLVTGLRPLGVILNVSGHREVHAIADPDPAGRFELDLSHLLEHLPVGYYSIGLHAFGTDYRQTSTKLVIEPEDFRLAAAGPHVHEVELEVTPWLFLTGSVVTERGAPARGGWVALLAGEPLEWIDSAEVRDGSFELRTTVRGDARLLFGDEQHVPGSRAVVLPAGGRVALEPLVLDVRGAELRGRLELPPPLAGTRARLVCTRALESAPPGPTWRGVRARDSGYELVEQVAETDPDGSFTLGGLEPGATYDLRLSHAGGRMSLVDMERLRVVAPADGLLLGADLGVLDVSVEAEGEPLQGAQVLLGWTRGPMTHRTGLPTDGDGRARCLVVRHEDYQLRIEHPGWAPVERALPAAGRPIEEELRVTLERLDDKRCTLVIEPEIPAGEPLHALRLELDPGQVRPPLVRELKVEAGRFVAENLPPGRHLVALEPVDIGRVHYCASYLRAESFEVELEPGQQLRRRVRFEFGGRIRVEAEPWEGGRRMADIDVLDEAGQRIAMRSTVPVEQVDGSVSRQTRASGDILLGAACELYPTLPPGRYELRLDEPDLVAPPVWCEVEAGRTVEVTLPVRAR